MKVLIDDERNFMGMDIIVRNFNAAKAVLEAKIATVLFLDFDLGSNDPLQNGEVLLKWGVDNDLIPKRVHIISMNPVGKKAMEYTLQDAGYKFDQSTVMWRK